MLSSMKKKNTKKKEETLAAQRWKGLHGYSERTRQVPAYTHECFDCRNTLSTP